MRISIRSQKTLLVLVSVFNFIIICIFLSQKFSSSVGFTFRNQQKTATKAKHHTVENVTLVVIISTAPERRQRRERIRKTYWQYCHRNSEVRCFFVTDGNVTSKVLKQLQEENRRHNDMVFQPLAGGREFGLRFYYQIRWAFAHFNFKYFLRADDDYFICLKRLIHELKYRPKKNLVWANFHCDGEELVWPDEAWMVFTRDMIQRFLSQNETEIICHPHADQQIALWLNDIPSKLYFHDDRLHHRPPAARLPKFAHITNICDEYMGLHGAYGDKMYEYHKVSNDGEKKSIPNITNFDSFCMYNTFDWIRMGGRFRFEPKLCNERPNWSLGHESWKGEEAEPVNGSNRVESAKVTPNSTFRILHN